MDDQKDIFRSANMIITQHGNNAERIALDKVDHFIKIDDVKGASTWLLIAQAVEKLKQDRPNGTVH